jgi:hypothetical protein
MANEDAFLKGEEMKKTRSERGFGIIEFDDRYGQKCSLQESSLATEAAIWFGVSNTGPLMGTDANKDVDHGRMHLTQSQVKKLLPHLQKFIKTGEI